MKFKIFFLFLITKCIVNVSSENASTEYQNSTEIQYREMRNKENVKCSVKLANCKAKLNNALINSENMTSALKQLKVGVMIATGVVSRTEITVQCVSDDLEACQKKINPTVSELADCKDAASVCEKQKQICTENLASTTTALNNCKANQPGDLQTCTTQLQNCQNDLAAMTTQKNTAETNYNTCQTQLANANTGYQQCQANAGTYGAKVDAANLETEKCKTDLVTAAANYNALRAQEAQCQAKVANLTTDLATCNTNFDYWFKKLYSAMEICSKPFAGLKFEKSPAGIVYYFAVSAAESKTWHGASEFCRSKGMDLVSIDSTAENTWVCNMVSTKFAENGFALSSVLFWTGLNKLDNLATWRWAGTGLAPTFYDWSPGQPNTPTSAHCVSIIKSEPTVTKWFDSACDAKGRFICELPQPCNLLFTLQDVPPPG